MAAPTSRKTIEHYRHALRTKPSPHLNLQGVRIARKVGNDLQDFDLVATSPKRRAVETAVAMGFAVEQTIKGLKDIPSGVSDRVPHDLGFRALAAAIPTERVIQDYLVKLRDLQIRLLERVPDGGRALLVSHGGLVEWSALAVWDEAANWGDALDKCEGIRLVFENGRCVDGSPLRLPRL